MADCGESTNFPGKGVLYEWASGCGSDDHLTKLYKKFGTTNTKSLNTSAETTSNTNDQSGAYTSSIVTRLNPEISVAGFATSKDSVTSNQVELYKLFHAEAQAGRQPSVWIKKSGPNLPIIEYLFCVVTSANYSENTDDLVAVEYTFATTDTGVPGKQSVIIVDVAP